MMFKFKSDVLIYGCMNNSQHRGTQKKLSGSLFWLWTRARHSPLFDNKEGTRRLSLQLAWDERGDTLSRCNISEVPWSTSFSLFLHVCILKGWGFSIPCTAKDTTATFGTILFTSNIPNEYNARGQTGVSSLLESLFVIRGMKVYGWRTTVALDAENELCNSIQAAATLERTCRLFIIWRCWVSHHGLWYHVDATGNLWSCLTT